MLRGYADFSFSAEQERKVPCVFVCAVLVVAADCWLYVKAAFSWLVVDRLLHEPPPPQR